MDIDSDGRYEALLLLGKTLSCVRTSPDGREGLLKWQIDLPARAGPPVIAHLDRDGRASILLAGDDGYVYCVQ